MRWWQKLADAVGAFIADLKEKKEEGEAEAPKKRR
jgi:hypothetical protein